MTLSMKSGLVFQEASPAAGSVLDLGGGAQINILFDKSVVVEDGVLIAGNYVDSLEVHTSGNAVTSELRTVLYSMLNKGRVKPGDKLTVKLEGVRAASDESVRYGEDGVFTIDYICPEIPVTLVSEKAISTVYSYWLPGDESGIMKLTFSDALDPTSPKVTFGYGNKEGNVGEYYTESVKYTVEGNTLTVDFTGVTRDPKSMLKSGTVYSSCEVNITNVRDAKGNYVYTPYSGALGSFSYAPAFAMAEGKYVVEFTPKSGSHLAAYDEIEVYLSGSNNVSYDGLQVVYTDAEGSHTVLLTAADYKLEQEGDEDIYTIPVQEAWKTASSVVVSLRNFVSKTGSTEGSEAKYNAFVVTGVNPVSGNTVGFLNAGDVIDVTTNRSKLIKNFIYEIHDLNAETADDFIIKSFAYLSTDADSLHWTAKVYGSYKFYTGHKYSFVFKAYNTQSISGAPFATDSIVINGGTVPYTYSDTQFSSITPAEGSVLTSVDQNCFTLEFDGLVTLDAKTTFINLGQGITLPFAQIENLTDSTLYGNKWSLYLPENYLEQHPGALSLTVVATDMQGKRVQGNEGEEEGTYFNFAYTNKLGVPELTCAYPVQGQSVESLSYLEVSCADGIAEAYSGQTIEVRNAMTGELVATVTECEPVYATDDPTDPRYYDDPTSIKLKLSQTLTDGGRYFATIPEGYFYLGAAAEYTSAELTIGIVIEPKQEAVATAVEADPADGSKVTSLKEIVLTFTEEEEVGPDNNYDSQIQVLDANGNAVSGVEMTFGTGYNQVNVTLKNEVTADGVYTIAFPEGAILLGADGDRSSSAFTLTYYIGVDPTGINGIAADKAAAVRVYNLQGVCVLRAADAAAVKALPAGVYVINGVKTVIR
jgi:hypothetical protein